MPGLPLAGGGSMPIKINSGQVVHAWVAALAEFAILSRGVRLEAPACA